MEMQNGSECPPEEFRGVVPPLVTPLNRNGEVDFDSLDRLLDFHLASGVDGFWINGTSGEFYAMDPEERLEILRAVIRKVAGRVPVIAQAGDSASRLVLRHAFAALEAGADAVAVVPPYYMPHSQDDLKRHFRLIVKEIGRPVFLYHVPQMCKFSLTVRNMVELAREGVLMGIKDSAGSLDGLYTLIREVREAGVAMRCFNGTSSLMDAGYFVGAVGFMGAVANILPAQCKKAYECAMSGQWDRVRELNAPVLALLKIMTSPEISASFTWLNKWFLRELGVIECDRVHEPASVLGVPGQERLGKHALPLLREMTPSLQNVS